MKKIAGQARIERLRKARAILADHSLAKVVSSTVVHIEDEELLDIVDRLGSI